MRRIHAFLAVVISAGLAACATSGPEGGPSAYSDPAMESAVSPAPGSRSTVPPTATAMAPQQEQDTSQPPITRYADQNRDGRVTRDEAAADPALARTFDRYDANRSNDLDRAEFARLEAESRERRSATPQPSTPPRATPPETTDESPVDASDAPLNRTGIDEIRGDTAE